MKKEDLNAILNNDEAMKKIAARVLDLTSQNPPGGVVCKGYFCDMGDKQLEVQKGRWVKQLKTHGLEVDDEIVSRIVKEIPLSEEEIAQTAIELKTGTKAKNKLKEEDMLHAARKVLADNILMARKGGASYEIPDIGVCTICGPYNTARSEAFSLNCQICGPNRGDIFTEVCVPCGPNKQGFFAECSLCGPTRGGLFNACTTCGPYRSNLFSECSSCGPNHFGDFDKTCSPAFKLPGCRGGFSYDIPDWRRFEDLIRQVELLQIQLQEIQSGLSRM